MCTHLCIINVTKQDKHREITEHVWNQANSALIINHMYKIRKAYYYKILDY